MSTPQTRLRDPESYLDPLTDENQKRLEAESKRALGRQEQILSKLTQAKSDPESYLDPLPATPKREFRRAVTQPESRSAYASRGYRQPTPQPQISVGDPLTGNVPNLQSIVTQLRERPDATAERNAERNATIREQVIKERYPTTVRGRIARNITRVTENLNPFEAGYNLLRPDEDIIAEETNRRIAQANRASDPEIVAEREARGQMSAPRRAIDDPVTRVGANAAKLLGGVSSLAGIAPNHLSEYLNRRGQVWEEGTLNAPLNQGKEVVRGVPEKIVSAIGDLGLGVAEIIAMKKASGLSLAKIMAIETALKTSDLPIRERAAQVAQATAMGKILDGHLSRSASAALFGGPTAVQSGTAYLQGHGSAEDAILNTAVQTLSGAALGGKKGDRLRQALYGERPDIRTGVAQKAVSPQVEELVRTGAEKANIGQNAVEEAVRVPLPEREPAEQGDNVLAAPRYQQQEEQITNEQPDKPEHHSASQQRRARNTEHGSRGQFKVGKIAEAKSPDGPPASSVGSSADWIPETTEIKGITYQVRDRGDGVAIVTRPDGASFPATKEQFVAMGGRIKGERVSDDTTPVPFPSVEYGEPDLKPLWQAWDQWTSAKDSPTQEVNLRDLTATQDAVPSDIVRGYEAGKRTPNEGDDIRVIRYQGKNYILGGHSRLSADLLAGKETAQVKFLDLDNPIGAGKTGAETIVNYEQNSGQVAPQSVGQLVSLPEHVTRVGERVGRVTRVDVEGKPLDITDPSGKFYLLKDGKPFSASVFPDDPRRAVVNSGDKSTRQSTSQPKEPWEMTALSEGKPVPPEVLATEPPPQSERATPKTLESEPEVKTSRLASGVEAKAIEAKLTQGFEGLPEYETVKVKDQAERAAKLLTDNPDQARRIALGKEVPPSDLLPESVFIAVENQALKNGDVDTLRDLATASSLPTEATGMGQRIRMLAERDPNSAVKAIRDVQLAREAKADRQVKDMKAVKEQIKTEIKTELNRAAPMARDWASFLDSIRC